MCNIVVQQQQRNISTFIFSFVVWCYYVFYFTFFSYYRAFVQIKVKYMCECTKIHSILYICIYTYTHLVALWLVYYYCCYCLCSAMCCRRTLPFWQLFCVFFIILFNATILLYSSLSLCFNSRKMFAEHLNVWKKKLVLFFAILYADTIALRFVIFCCQRKSPLKTFCAIACLVVLLSSLCLSSFLFCRLMNNKKTI